MLGRPWHPSPRHGGLAAPSMLAALFFAAAAAAALEAQYWLAVAAWLLSGAASAAMVSRLHGLYSGLRRLAEETLDEPPRPVIGYWTAVATAAAAPPAAGLLGLAAVAGIEEIVALLAEKLGAEAEPVIERFRGRIPDAAAAAAASAVPLLLPIAAAQLEQQAAMLACLAYSLASRLAPRLRDKPCIDNVVDVVVWAEPHGLSLDLQPLSEKWSIKD